MYRGLPRGSPQLRIARHSERDIDHAARVVDMEIWEALHIQSAIRLRLLLRCSMFNLSIRHSGTSLLSPISPPQILRSLPSLRMTNVYSHPMPTTPVILSNSKERRISPPSSVISFDVPRESSQPSTGWILHLWRDALRRVRRIGINGHDGAWPSIILSFDVGRSELAPRPRS